MKKTLFSKRSKLNQCINECPCRRPHTLTLRGLRYAILNQCSDNWAIHGREWLDSAFQDYPSDSSNDLQGRFKSKKDKDHRGAYFELITHTLLRSSGATIDAHPRIDGWGCEPDFLVKPENREFVVEAKTIATPDAHKYTLTPSEEKICKDLEELKDELFYYEVVFAGEEQLKQDISFKDIKRGIAPLRAWGKSHYDILKSYPPFLKLNERIDDAVGIDKHNEHFRSQRGLMAAIRKRRDDVAVIERDGWKMYVSLIHRRSPETSPDRAIYNLPTRHHNWRDQDKNRDNGTGRFGVDERLNNELNTWDSKYKNICVPVVLAVHVMGRHCFNPVHNWITQFFYGDQGPDSCSPTDDGRWMAGRYDGWFSQSKRRFDAVWVFTGLNPWRMFMTRHQIYFNPAKKNHRVIREALSPYISSSMMADQPPTELSQFLGCDFSITIQPQ